MLFSQRTEFTVPAGDGDYAPEAVTIPRRLTIFGITTVIEEAATDAEVQVWVLKDGGDQDEALDYFLWRSSATGETYSLAGVAGVQIRVVSGGNAGLMPVNVFVA